ncbi:uncharacterized protein LOC112502352 isoform X2 [Cynara cardunculus var. scolymus]|uniref:uncharacterized protein LOC112502352 isoform X2 n=1 Tax=Cynara cardunculus var. scolymus TaxID=59895 RepID=UPI000D6279BF|nr:uncharacterized protein LOC112502352 isoform X2 [Cynara cardunculus var. scolymus]
MGNAQSPAGDPRFTSATRAFSEKELDDLKSLFGSLAAQSQSGGKYISLSAFKAYIGISGPLGDRLYDIVTQNRKDQKLTFEDLVIAKGTYEKGTKEEIDEFLYQLCDVDGDGNLTRSDLEAVISEILDNISSSRNYEPSSAPEQRPIGIFLDAANFTKDNEGSCGRSMSFEDFRSWCRFVPSARKFLISLLKPSSQGSQVPDLIHQDDIDSNMLLLKEYAWHIGGALSHQELEEWKLLYHSALHGQSFNTFLGNMSWCGVNFSSDSIPNGIGFGGRTSHFNLFISSNFDHGHTFTGATFNSPCLSKSSQIYAEVIECWGIVAKGGQHEKQEGLKGSVLERFKEDRNMLNLVGLANSSN